MRFLPYRNCVWSLLLRVRAASALIINRGSV